MTGRSLTPEEMERADNYDHEAEVAEVEAIYLEQVREEEAEEDAEMESHRIAIEADRLVEQMEQHEYASQQGRIRDEVNDRKEEDGGEYYPLLYP